MSSQQLTFERVKVPLSKADQSFEGGCEFAGAVVFPGASGRKCKIDGCLCSESAYSNMRVFWHCFLRTRELKRLEKEKV